MPVLPGYLPPVPRTVHGCICDLDIQFRSGSTLPPLAGAPARKAMKGAISSAVRPLRLRITTVPDARLSAARRRHQKYPSYIRVRLAISLPGSEQIARAGQTLPSEYAPESGLPRLPRASTE